MKYPRVQNFINGRFVDSTASSYLRLVSPVDGVELSEVPLSPAADLDEAVDAANKIFATWAKTPIKERVQVFFRYKYLLEKNLRELAALIQEENGKTLGEAVAELEKCIE
jgi:malonate-semialdehyde dehydrogenase (acetylating)/methylmalonate-semialdehyde dehydrogenase